MLSANVMLTLAILFNKLSSHYFISRTERYIFVIQLICSILYVFDFCSLRHQKTSGLNVSDNFIDLKFCLLCKCKLLTMNSDSRPKDFTILILLLL